MTLELQPERAYLRRLDSIAITELPGYQRGRHRVPTEHGRGGEQLVHGLGEAALTEEIRQIYDAAKRLLGLRRRELIRAVADGGGNVDTPQFRFVLELGLDPRDVRRALWQRRVDLLVEADALPVGFDELFPVACDELVIPFAGALGDGQGDGDSDDTLFDVLVERLEDFAEAHGGNVEEDEDQGRAWLTTSDGSRLALDVPRGELCLRILGVDGARELMLETRKRFADLAALLD